MDRPIRVLLGKVGLDGHDRGAKVVAASLREAGMEVIYTGLHRTPEQIARAAVEEDVDIVGLSILSGAHRRLVRRVVEELKEFGGDDIPVMVGGIIPSRDEEYLPTIGVSRVFGPGSSIQEIVQFTRGIVEARRRHEPRRG